MAPFILVCYFCEDLLLLIHVDWIHLDTSKWKIQKPEQSFIGSSKQQSKRNTIHALNVGSRRISLIGHCCFDEWVECAKAFINGNWAHLTAYKRTIHISISIFFIWNGQHYYGRTRIFIHNLPFLLFTIDFLWAIDLIYLIVVVVLVVVVTFFVVVYKIYTAVCITISSIE